MDFYLILLFHVFTSTLSLGALESSGSITSKTRRDLIIIHRAKKALELIRGRTCKQLTAGQNCTAIKTRPISSMNFYMAEKLSKASSLSMLIPLRPSPFDLYKKIDVVVVIDPIPDAHFGHVIVVALVKVGITEIQCNALNGLYYTSPISKSECMYLPVNNNKCLLTAQLSPSKRRERLRRSCSFDFIPFVYDTSDPGVQQLKCYSTIHRFGTCPKSTTSDSQNNYARCRNKRCSFPVSVTNNNYKQSSTNSGRTRGRNSDTTTSANNQQNRPTCGWSCDYALLISGGWSKYTNRMRHLHNIQDIYRHLNTKRSFDEKNIKVFFANNSTIELGNSMKTTKTSSDSNNKNKNKGKQEQQQVRRTTTPAVDALTITRHVRAVCSRDVKCIDTFVIYLNGPTTKSGDLLLWDWNADGKASRSEILTIEELLYPIQNCNAKNYLLVADQNYAGHLVEYVQLGRKLKRRNFDKITVLTASNKNSYTWKRDFTKMFVQLDNSLIDEKTTSHQAKPSARRISSIAEGLSKSPKLKAHMNIRYLSGSNKDLTLIGEFGQTPGCS